MNLYARKQRWKLYLAIIGILIVGASMLFTNYLVNKLEVEERKRVDQFVYAYESITDPNIPANCDFTLNTKIMEENTTIPIILVNAMGGIDDARNFGEKLDTSMTFLKEELLDIKLNGYKPLEINTNIGKLYIYYKNSWILTLLRYFPYIQLLLISSFIFFGYLTFSNARQAEQNQVWVGMAKETAHQLGTPLSAIIGWIEHLKTTHPDDSDTQEVLVELENDVSRLNLVADRFSKIGSSPELSIVNVYDDIERCRQYMQRRSPRKVIYDFPGTTHEPLMVAINAHLFDWVIENLIRNALDAMEGEGKISAHIYTEDKFVCIDLSDTGKGIHSGKFKTVFKPGYTTKKRGWGLGLSLTKRIIVDYHKGKIFVKKSVVNEGSTFTIKLPKKI